MGGNQSAPTRKLTIPNEESHFIKVSESVAERLRKCTEGSPEDFVKNQNQKQKENECPPNAFEEHVSNKENMPPNRDFSGDALINYYYGPSLTSLRVLQEKEKELKESEVYWSKRIQNMEDHHAKLSKIMEDEYNKAVLEISCQNPRPPPNTPFPCFDEKNKVLQCYKKNPNEILLCAGEVNEFSDCVHTKRVSSKRPPGCEK